MTDLKYLFQQSNYSMPMAKRLKSKSSGNRVRGIALAVLVIALGWWCITLLPAAIDQAFCR